MSLEQKQNARVSPASSRCHVRENPGSGVGLATCGGCVTRDLCKFAHGARRVRPGAGRCVFVAASDGPQPSTGLRKEGSECTPPGAPSVPVRFASPGKPDVAPLRSKGRFGAPPPRLLRTGRGVGPRFPWPGPGSPARADRGGPGEPQDLGSCRGRPKASARARRPSRAREDAPRGARLAQ